MSHITFNDKKGRQIEIKDNDKGLIAIHDEEVIGEFDYEHISFDDDYTSYEFYKLNSMNIKSDYQRAGIGTEMLKLGVKLFEKIQYPEDNTENYPTIEGAAFLNAASSAGIIRLNNIHSDDEESDSEYYDSQLDLDTTPDHEMLTRNETDSGTIDKDLNSILSDIFGEKVVKNVTSIDEFIGEDQKLETTDLNDPTKCDDN
ncbi:hypothetical protein [Paenibacillus sp. PK1-4R]|uniref:hypothetical protein n=1 Tax=Paenibacillus sp. PK1-4R TaxID=3049075 RepID=UPI0025A0A054|nr:hypothetical protein [Paenibacillus sp. PK1-4R]WJM05869.1 hypothetical protein QNO02_16430 [Paenibacillus sp. PK1-4R]